MVTDLPESDGKTAIAIFVDRLSKMVHFAPCTKEISVEKYASSSSIMCSSIMVYRKSSSPTDIQGSPIAFGKCYSRSSEQISSSV